MVSLLGNPQAMQARAHDPRDGEGCVSASGASDSSRKTGRGSSRAPQLTDGQIGVTLQRADVPPTNDLAFMGRHSQPRQGDILRRDFEGAVPSGYQGFIDRVLCARPASRARDIKLPEAWSGTESLER